MRNEPGEQRVYFALPGQEVKIATVVDPARRMAKMRDARPDIRLLGDMPGGRQLEKQLHEWLWRDRIGGEWFRLSAAVADAISASLAVHNGTRYLSIGLGKRSQLVYAQECFGKTPSQVRSVQPESGLFDAQRCLERVFIYPNSRPSLRWFRELYAAGKIPYLKICRRVWFDPKEVRRALDEQLQAGGASNG
jgi:hypothetical protein